MSIIINLLKENGINGVRGLNWCMFRRPTIGFSLGNYLHSLLLTLWMVRFVRRSLCYICVHSFVSKVGLTCTILIRNRVQIGVRYNLCVNASIPRVSSVRSIRPFLVEPKTFNITQVAGPQPIHVEGNIAPARRPLEI